MEVSTVNLRNLPRRHFLKCFSALTVAVSGGMSSCCTSNLKRIQPSALSDRFFVMDTFFWDEGLNAEKQIKILQRFNQHKGTDCRTNWEQFPGVLTTFDRHNIEMAAVYLPLSIDEPVPSYVAPLMKSLKGRRTLIWLNPTSQKHKPSDTAGDPAAIGLIQNISDIASDNDLQISLYHHRGNWMERVNDVYRLAVKSKRDNVGCTFNLYHWLCTANPGELESAAALVMPKLNCITINGTMINASRLDVRQAILPLNQGDYDVANFVRTFINLGYNGSFCFQGYGISGDIESKLAQSLQTWENICDSIQS
jgi:hypothetical protein